MPSSLILDDVTKRYGDGPAVIDGLTHTFDPGSLTLLEGPNGAGKTTLLRLLSVLAYPTSGTVTYGGLHIHDEPYRYLQDVGIVHAAGQLPEHLTAEELLAWILRSRGRWTDASPDKISDLLDQLHLDERRTNLIGTYSSGMLQKTQFAAALVADPAVLLMDEPLRSLDASTREIAVELLGAFVEEDGLVVVASHLKDMLSSLTDVTLSLRHRETETVRREPA